MPGHSIPEPFKWDKSFEVFYANLDDEHKGLFDGVFKLAEDKSSAGALGSLLQKVKDHFGDEEGMMKSKGYGDYSNHKQLHDDFVAKLSSLSAPVDDGTINFAKDWLVNHIKDTDFKYKGKL